MQNNLESNTLKFAPLLICVIELSYCVGTGHYVFLGHCIVMKLFVVIVGHCFVPNCHTVVMRGMAQQTVHWPRLRHVYIDQI